ncbi:hypothetical protein [Microbulbifer sediminum]|uniref:hypothetical protein n=1 Tax=Microbulbifer sediminum TaxID=2904250 RepID=UPI001F28286C|nr:hypothetical protein [Microbulbifer sediminum]
MKNKKHSGASNPRLLLLLPVLLVSACASGPLPVPGLKESFHTEIARNGAKRFTYALEIMRNDIPLPATASGMNSNRMAQQGMVQPRNRVRPLSDRLQFDRMLRQKLAETGFCRDGFFELERTEYAYGGEVRGECRDGVSG